MNWEGRSVCGLCMKSINGYTFANEKPRNFVKILTALYSFVQGLGIAAQQMKLQEQEPVVMIIYQ